MPAGRPPFYTSLEQLEEKIAEYWEYIKGELNLDGTYRRQPEHPTITGLALFLGFTTRQALINYQEKPEFVDTIKKAKLRIESNYEQALFGKNAAGPIFALKNFDWKDKQEVEQSGTIRIKYEDPGDYLYPSQDQSNSGIPESV